jgi:RNA polymerase sigma factor (sigma-70 family)
VEAVSKLRQRRFPAEPAAPPAGASLGHWFADLAAGRLEALDPLYDALADEVHGIGLWRTGSAADAADVLQEVFMKLALAGRKLARVRAPRAYVRRMAHRAAVDVHRRRQRRGEEPLDSPDLVVGGRPDLEARVDAGTASRHLLALAPEQREAIYLHLFAGCSFAEVGRATGVPTFTAASRYRRGMAGLRRRMGVKP